CGTRCPLACTLCPFPTLFRSGVRFGDGDGVGGVDLDGGRARPFGHETHRLGGDGKVLGGDHGPGRDGLPGGLGGLAVEGGGGDGPLGGGHEFGDLQGDVGGEHGWELVLLDVEVGGGAAAGDRDGHRVERGPELPAGGLGGHGRGACADVPVEAGGVDVGPDARAAAGG